MKKLLKLYLSWALVGAIGLGTPMSTYPSEPQNEQEAKKSNLALSAQKMNTWLKGVKTRVVNYAKSSLPQTKRGWLQAIISEGVAEGILMFKGLGMLKRYKRDKAEDIIEQSKGVAGIFIGSITELNREETDKDIVRITEEVIKKTVMEGKVKAHYASGMQTGALSHAKSHIFLPATMEAVGPLAPKGEKEIAFITAHELGHIKSKDHLKFAAAAIGAPVLTLAMTKILDKATSLIIDQLIKTMKLTEKSTGYKILTKFKYGKSRILRNPILRYLIAAHIFAAYSRYREKQADLFAAQYGYAEGGTTIFKRLDEQVDPFSKAFDVMHPKPKTRIEYLKEEERKMRKK